MPYELVIAQNQLSHTGSFARPLFELWGEGRSVLQGLYDAFLPYGATLANIRNESASQSPADQVAAVTLGLNKVHRFRVDRVETTIQNFSEKDLEAFPRLLEASSNWIRAAAPSFKFSSHVFTYAGHGNVKGGTVSDILKSLGPRAPESGGVDQGTGLSYHWEVPARGWKTQMALDHSVVLRGGLFILFTLRTDADRLDYGKLAREGRTYLDGVLRDLGLGLASAA